MKGNEGVKRGGRGGRRENRIIENDGNWRCRAKIREKLARCLASSFDRFAVRDVTDCVAAGLGGYHGNESDGERRPKTGKLEQVKLSQVSVPLWHLPAMKLCCDYGSAARLASSASKWHVALRNDIQTQTRHSFAPFHCQVSTICKSR